MVGNYNPEKHRRRSIRLREYDYSRRGAYFVTICTQNRECLFGNIQHNEMVLNQAGEMAYKTCNNLSIKCPGIEIDEFIIMPNHVHGIIIIVGAPLVGALSVESRMDVNDRAGIRPNRRAGTRPAPTSLGDVVGIFKSISTHQYAINVNANNWPAFPGKLWQRNYYERIIRNDDELNRIREYISNNPLHWDNDENNPANLKDFK
jgi:REP element-mobilizing transposase RayT